jgi:hypothetical protein
MFKQMGGSTDHGIIHELSHSWDMLGYPQFTSQHYGVLYPLRRAEGWWSQLVSSLQKGKQQNINHQVTSRNNQHVILSPQMVNTFLLLGGILY